MWINSKTMSYNLPIPIPHINLNLSTNLVIYKELVIIYSYYRSMKGVEYYIFDFVKILGVYGIRKFDVVPEWAKNVIKFVVDKQGPSIVK